MVWLTADETLDDSRQLSWPTPEFTHGNSGAVNSGMPVTIIISLKFISSINMWRNNFCSDLLVI